MIDTIQQLYPLADNPVPLRGLYLGHALHKKATGQQPFIYANFISSLDGRIGLQDPDQQTHRVPDAIANPRDWRLYQELAAQADILLTSSRYFRQAATNTAQDLLPIGSEADFQDLRAWRLQQGLQPQPDIAILSSQLDIPEIALEPYLHRQIHVFTGNTAPTDKINALQASGITVHVNPSDSIVNGHYLIEQLKQHKYRSIYAISGPQVLYTLIKDRVLNRLYLSQTHQILGGQIFDTFAWGPELKPPVALTLNSLYYDTKAPAGAAQWLSTFDIK
ncbi:MAG: pyrimidine reductase [Gammaproteobacteria bacterium]|nr:pyrimidine reductase [Gammaproteobacteria bacterium]